MRVRWRPFVLLALVGGVLAGDTFAQSLGAAAEKEKKKREASPSPAPSTEKKVYTGEDLAGIAASREDEGTKAPAPAPRAEGPVPAITLPLDPQSPGPDESEMRVGTERAWRARKAAADRAVRVAEQEVERAQQNRNRLGPTPPSYQEPSSWTRAANGADARLAAANAGHEAAKAAVEQLEEDARRAGVPPGWLR